MTTATMNGASTNGITNGDPHKNLAAVIEGRGARVSLVNRPIPTPGHGELLVRNRAVACNPIEWKVQDWGLFMNTYPTVLGSDVAGEVVAIGAGVTEVAVGDRVTGYSGVYHNQQIDHGAWQTYTILPELATTKIPGSLSFERAAALPMGMAAAAVALFHCLGLPREPLPEGSRDALIVWGAASCVGASAVQIARIQGWRVIATASPRHHGWLRDIGAVEIFDYHDPEVVDKVGRAAAEHGFEITRALDPISEGETLDLVPAALKAAGGAGGRVATVIPRSPDKPEPEGVEVVLSAAMRHAKDLSELGRWFFTVWLRSHLADGSIVTAPSIEVVDGGIAAAQTVYDTLKAGVSGKKLVVRVA